MTNPKLFSDLADLAGGAIGVISSIKQQLRDETRERMGEFANRLEIVTRDDIDRLEGMVAKLRARVDALEKSVGGKTAKQPTPKTKTVPKKSSRSTSKKKK